MTRPSIGEERGTMHPSKIDLTLLGLQTVVLSVLGAALGALALGALGGPEAAGWGGFLGVGAGPLAGFALRRAWALARARDAERSAVVDAFAELLDDARVSGAQAAGTHRGQAVRFWTEPGNHPGQLEIRCSVRAARGEVYLATVHAAGLGIAPFDGPGALNVRPGGLGAAWLCEETPDVEAARGWARSILAEADARRVAEERRVERLVELAGDGRPSAFEALVADVPDDPRLAALARRLADSPAPAARLAAARWFGAAALEALVDALAYEPTWQARALQARAEAGPLPADAVARWAGVPALHLELLIDQVRRGPVEIVEGLVDAAPAWPATEDARLEALADALVERGAEVEPGARRLFDTQVAGRRALARALAELGGLPALATLRAAWGAVDWPQFDEDEAAVEQAIARIVHRLGDSAAGGLALEPQTGETGRLSVARRHAAAASAAPATGPGAANRTERAPHGTGRSSGTQ